MRSMSLGLSLFLCFSSAAQAAESLTGKKDFFPWLWDDQIVATVKDSWTPQGQMIALGGVLGSLAANTQDQKIFEANLDPSHRLMDSSATEAFAVIGNGGLGIGIAVAQLVWDRGNGLMHARAIGLTSITHVMGAALVQRKRPGDRKDFLPFPSSFPSGHSSSAFATATALAYAYGWKAGVPAYLAATSIAAARVSENAHWLSDVVAGAALGMYWGQASFRVKEKAEENSISWMPILTSDGFEFRLSSSW